MTEYDPQPVTEIVVAEPESQANSLMTGILRAASDPNTDVDKLERLAALYERSGASRA